MESIVPDWSDTAYVGEIVELIYNEGGRGTTTASRSESWTRERP